MIEKLWQGFSFNAGFHLMMQFSSCVVQGWARNGTVLRFLSESRENLSGICGTGPGSRHCPGTTAHPWCCLRQFSGNVSRNFGFKFLALL